MLTHPRDRTAVAVVAMVVAVRLWAVATEQAFSPWLFAVSVLAMPSVWVIKHNVIHHRMFRHRRLDRAFRSLLTMLTGTSTANTALIHNAIHHRHNNSADDWTSIDYAPRFRWRLAQMATYPFVVVAKLPRNRAAYLRNRPALTRRIVIESGLSLVVLAAAVVRSPTAAAWYVVIPVLFGQWFLIAMNYLQHIGCRHDSALDHSVNFTGRSFNRLMFNVGYHTAHHLHPSRHWSELPAVHRTEVVAQMDPALAEPSFWRYVFRDVACRFDGHRRLPVQPVER